MYSVEEANYGSAESLVKTRFFAGIADGSLPYVRMSGSGRRLDSEKFDPRDLDGWIESRVEIGADKIYWPSYLLREDDVYAWLDIKGVRSQADANLTVAGPDRDQVESFYERITDRLPKKVIEWDASRVPINFWSMSSQGPKSTTRDLDVPTWDDIRGNYAEKARNKFDEVFSDDFVPGKGGQLHLWHGPPGTGKTYALRALSQKWFPWADMHYITDPETFFTQSASYMLDVLLSQPGQGPAMGDRPTDPRALDGRWKVLILEDAGEMMSADARARAGQGLSRLLNVVDGMIGQGIRVLVICTTNEEVNKLHAAVQRPGRCASIILVPKLTAEEVFKWRDENDVVEEIGSDRSLAELYELKSDAPAVERTSQGGRIGFGV